MSVSHSASEQRHLQSLFQLVDRDHSGSISKLELASLLRSLHLTTSQAELDSLISSCDTNNDGEIDYEEFIHVMSRRQQAAHRREELVDAFRAFEGVGGRRGVLSVAMLEKAVEMFMMDGDNAADDRRKATRDALQRLTVDAGGGFHYEQVTRQRQAHTAHHTVTADGLAVMASSNALWPTLRSRRVSAVWMLQYLNAMLQEK